MSQAEKIIFNRILTPEDVMNIIKVFNLETAKKKTKKELLPGPINNNESTTHSFEEIKGQK